MPRTQGIFGGGSSQNRWPNRGWRGIAKSFTGCPASVGFGEREKFARGRFGSFNSRAANLQVAKGPRGLVRGGQKTRTGRGTDRPSGLAVLGTCTTPGRPRDFNVGRSFHRGVGTRAASWWRAGIQNKLGASLRFPAFHNFRRQGKKHFIC